MKASDITDTQIYAVVAAPMRWEIGKGPRYTRHVEDFEEALPDVPCKVIMAKLRQMVSKGRIGGCACGCRGDFLFPWEEFGGPYNRDNWQERVKQYYGKGRKKKA